jgi:hypothetical protein
MPMMRSHQDSEQGEGQDRWNANLKEPMRAEVLRVPYSEAKELLSSAFDNCRTS